MTGASKKDVCVTFEISMSTVNRLLRLNPSVDEKLNKNFKLKKLEEQRTLWRCAVDKSPAASANVIKRSVPSVYAWLYRNDQSWLLSQTASLPSGRAGNHVAIDWDARDENLCSLIKKVLVTSTTEPRKIRKRDLYQMVPSLFLRLSRSRTIQSRGSSSPKYHSSRFLTIDCYLYELTGIRLHMTVAWEKALNLWHFFDLCVSNSLAFKN